MGPDHGGGKLANVLRRIDVRPSISHSNRTMSGIGVVLNPRSRKNLRDPRAGLRLARTLGDQGIVRQVDSIDALHRAAEDFRDLHIDVLGIAGGDGTNHVTITGFLDVYGEQAPITLPQIAFLRGGTMNTAANSVGVRHDRPESLLARLMRAYAERATLPLANVERRVMRIGGVGAPRGAHQYGFLFGTGVVYGYLAEYYAGGEPSPLVAAKTLARGIGSTMVGGEMIRRMAAPFRGSVTLDDGTTWEERDYLSVAAGTIDQIGLSFRPFYRWNERPETFHLLGIFASPFQFVCDLPRIRDARPMRPGRTYEATPSRAVIRGAEPKVRYLIDGDLHETTGEIELSIGPPVKIVLVA
jgi:diacylglycerol kinase (ATP)